MAEFGIRARLRCVSRKGWRFESSRPHPSTGSGQTLSMAEVEREDEKFILNEVEGSPLVRTFGLVAQLVRASRLHREGLRFESSRVHSRQADDGTMKKINEKSRNWEPASHEDPKDPGVWKRVIVKRDEVDSRSKLMMINVSRVPVGKTHVAHSHATMEEIFYFTEGQGEIKIDGEIESVGPGDRVIVPAKKVHQIRNTGNSELKFIGLGIALD